MVLLGRRLAWPPLCHRRLCAHHLESLLLCLRVRLCHPCGLPRYRPGRELHGHCQWHGGVDTVHTLVVRYLALSWHEGGGRFNIRVFRFECKGPALVVRYRRMLWHGGACTLVVRYKHASWHGGVVECTGTQTWMNECVSYDFLWVSAAFADFFALSPVDTYGIKIFIYVFIFLAICWARSPARPCVATGRP